MIVVRAACQEEFARLTVDYITMPGWLVSTERVRKFDDLPKAAQDYVRKIEELLSVPGTAHGGA